jgi:hypothetical protein
MSQVMFKDNSATFLKIAVHIKYAPWTAVFEFLLSPCRVPLLCSVLNSI